MDAEVLLFGRVTYEGMAEYWQTAEGTIADFMNSVQKVVFSRTLDSVDWTNSRLVNDSVPEAVRRLKQEGNGTMFVFGSADFSSTLIEQGLVDEYRLGINPLILGTGTPFFKGGGRRVDLKLVHARPLKSGLVILHYQPA
jgi:dihydrofolate reductase